MVWVNPRLLDQMGALERKMNSFTMFFTQSLHCAVRKRRYLYIHSDSGGDRQKTAIKIRIRDNIQTCIVGIVGTEGT